MSLNGREEHLYFYSNFHFFSNKFDKPVNSTNRAYLGMFVSPVCECSDGRIGIHFLTKGHHFILTNFASWSRTRNSTKKKEKYLWCRENTFGEMGAKCQKYYVKICERKLLKRLEKWDLKTCFFKRFWPANFPIFPACQMAQWMASRMESHWKSN